MIATLVVLASCSTSAPPVTTSGSQPTDLTAYASEIVLLTNQVRAERDLGQLAPSNCAAEAARARAEALVDAPLEHASLTGVIKTCAPPSGLAAENLSRAASAPSEVIAAWLGSPGHANNLLSPQLTQIGVGCVLDEDAGQQQVLCAQVFLG